MARTYLLLRGITIRGIVARYLYPDPWGVGSKSAINNNNTDLEVKNFPDLIDEGDHDEQIDVMRSIPLASSVLPCRTRNAPHASGAFCGHSRSETRRC